MLYEVLETIGQTPTEETIAAWIMEMVQGGLDYEIDSDYGNDYATWAIEEKGQPLQIVTRPRYAKTLFEDFSECCLFELEGANPTAWEDSLEDTQFENDIAAIKRHWLHLDWLKVWDCLDKTKVSAYKLI